MEKTISKNWIWFIIIIIAIALVSLGFLFLPQRKTKEILINYYDKYKAIPFLTVSYNQIGNLKEVNTASGLSKEYHSLTNIILLKKDNLEKVGITPNIKIPEFEISTSNLKEFWEEQIKDERYIFEDKSYNCYISYIEERRNQTTGETETIKKWTCDENVSTVDLLESSISEIYNNLITLQKNNKLNIKSVRNADINGRICKSIEFQPDFFAFMKVFKENINLENVENGDISGSVCIDENGILIRYGINYNVSFKREVIPFQQIGKSEFNIAGFNFNELSDNLFILPTEK